MSRPTILLVPGLWEGPTVFNTVAEHLRALNYETCTAELASTGTKSPGNPTMYDDIAAIRKTIESCVQPGRDVVLVLHSAAGFLGSEAMKGLDKKSRQSTQKEGGVVKIIFLTAGVADEGHVHGALPFVEERDGIWHCKDPRNLLFGDMSDSEAERWMAAMQSQPSQGWNGTTEYCGWKIVPSVYIFAKQDTLLPMHLQEHFAKVAGSQAVETMEAAHMPQLSQPSELAKLIDKHASDLEESKL